MDKLLRIDLGRQMIKEENLPEAWQKYGGRALTAAVLRAEVNPKVDPLSPGNKLVLAAGLLAGSGVPCSGRLSIGAKSPLTGTIKESNVGGTAAQRLARLGYRGIIIEGKAENGPAVLVVKGDGAVLELRPQLAGLGNYQTAARLLAEYGPEAAVISIGPVGELALPVASVAVTNREGLPSRHAGRGGMGAVMGSKGLKAIVLVGKDGVSRPAAQPEQFTAAMRAWSEGLIKGKKALTRFGTAMLVNVINGIGGLPTRNYRQGRFELAEKLSGEELEARATARGGRTAHACHRGCVIRCSNIYHDEQGQYLTSALEYETLCLLGSNLGIGDIDAVARFDRLCDDLGMDTMETGAALGVAMEGGLLAFGDTAGVEELLKEVGAGTVRGRLLGQGAATVGKVLGVKRVPAVKGQSLSAYDPRALKGTGVTYATSPMGADHTAGNCLPGRGGLDTKQAAGQVDLSRQLQIISAACDALGVCIFVGPTPDNVDPLAQQLTYFNGNTWHERDLLELGKEVLAMELEFNRQAGFGPEDDDLPAFFREEVLPETGTVFDLPQSQLAEVFSDFFRPGGSG
ncbi:aldehyde:ferredoxin oxidoreductase [Carboxydocella sporoproducens DSM 16521]|uniref:Aldehyde:ferredoxin oxidoreductase n=2 Tax=Carboxydocella TaxID=178898 RepID=A0A1T4M025_9FIRM|nr:MULTISPECIES: aldehyde ferredoxin oxidoreductase C-terminal domain-containing protein [Carboxydocella]AVX21109.1 aldehyde:ferredoxin oxidoreductase [Carboxydocella thermautotrophica]SJZ60339.1 aldehyde:ferredoxin oxidoreductase [Carboxydocella sporoproducens DSM 16521]